MYVQTYFRDVSLQMIESIEDLSGISSFQLKYISSATLSSATPFLYIIDSAILGTFSFLFFLR